MGDAGPVPLSVIASRPFQRAPFQLPVPFADRTGAIPTLASFEAATASAAASAGSTPSITEPPTGSTPTVGAGRLGVPSMSLNPRLAGADTTGQETLESEGSFTSH